MHDDSRQAGTTTEEIEITPEMIEVGAECLATNAGASEAYLAGEVFQAMWRRMPKKRATRF
jgi:hypothetical protein